MHVALLPGAIVEVAMQPAFDVNTNVPRPAATSVAELLTALDRSLATAETTLRRMDDGALASLWRTVDGERDVMRISRAALIRTVMLNHWYHHRGQLTVYLPLSGAPVPATYGPSADENPSGMTRASAV